MEADLWKTGIYDIGDCQFSHEVCGELMIGLSWEIVEATELVNNEEKFRVLRRNHRALSATIP